jgi:hypothetical protein
MLRLDKVTIVHVTDFLYLIRYKPLTFINELQREMVTQKKEKKEKMIYYINYLSETYGLNSVHSVCKMSKTECIIGCKSSQKIA